MEPDLLMKIWKDWARQWRSYRGQIKLDIRKKEKARKRELSTDISREKLLVSHRAPPQVADRGTLTRYGGYCGNKISGVDQN